MYRHILGRVDANTDLVPLDPQYGHRNFVPDHHGLADTSCQYQHSRAPSFVGIAATAIAAFTTAWPSSIFRGPGGGYQIPPREFRALTRVKNTRILTTLRASCHQNKQ